MKNTKRVLIGLVAVVMLVSGMLLSSFANEAADGSAQLPDYQDVLKYYDPLYSALYEDESFEDGEFDGTILLLDAAAPYTSAKVAGNEDKYLAIELGHILNPDARTNAMYSVDFDGAKLSKIIFRAEISAAHKTMSAKQCPGCTYSTENTAASLCPICQSALVTVSAQAPTVVVAIAENGGAGAPLITFDFSKGAVSYYDGADDKYIEGLTISEDSWYGIEVVCDSTQYKFKLTDGETIYEYSAVNSPAYSIAAVNIGARYVDDARGATVKLDDIFVQAGIDDRNTGVDLYAATNNGLLILDTLLRDETVSVETKNDVIAVFDTLDTTYADKLALDADGEAYMASVRSAMLDFFAAQLKAATDAIDTSAAYTVRLALIENNAMYADRITALLEVIENADCAALLALYNGEKAALESTAAISDSFVSYINDALVNESEVFSSDDYEILKSFVEITEENYADADGNPIYDATYPPIKDALSSYNVVSNKYYNSLAKAEEFCANVALAKLAEEDLALGENGVLTDDEFRAGLVAYAAASKSTFRNASYPGMPEAIADLDALVSIAGISVVAERFMNYVATAEQAIYIFMKEEWLDLAAADYDITDSRYAGVAEAKALYNELRQQIADMKAAADAYIAAVAAIEGKDGAELIAAVETALALKDAGNVQGYEGVTEANIALDNAYRSYQLEQAYAQKFITLTAMIKDAKTLEERFAAIGAATEAQGFALDEIAGVSAAKADLVAATSLYNAEIAAINSASVSVASNAGIFASAATTLSEIIKLVASAIGAIVG